VTAALYLATVAAIAHISDAPRPIPAIIAGLAVLAFIIGV
jgi:hypothetical protein